MSNRNIQVYCKKCVLVRTHTNAMKSKSCIHIMTDAETNPL